MEGRLFFLPPDKPEPGSVTRTCIECKECKPLKLFTKQGVTTGRGSIFYAHRCKTCHAKQSKMRQRLHNEGAYERLWHAQGGECAIASCHRALPIDGKGPGERLNLDHDHVSGAARGLLCLNHNQGLGKFADDADSLLGGVLYLKPEHPLAAIIAAYLQLHNTCVKCQQPTEGNQS
jgi:hypothetical protein